MNRRDFIRLAALSGAGAQLPWLAKTASAAAPYTGIAFINVHASGGWDTSSFCDPKQRGDVNHWADTQNAGQAGNLRYAPFADNQAFFNKYFDRTLVVNGIHGRTNSHSAGRRHQVSGRLANGYPTMEGLLSAVQGSDLPMAYMGQGILTETAGGVVRYTKASGNVVKEVAAPNDRSGGSFFSESALDLISQRHQQRSNEMLQQDYLPRAKAGISDVLSSRLSKADLKQFGATLPSSFDDRDLTGDRYSTVTQADIALRAIAGGVCTSASVQTGGFDTHSDHDNRHTPRLARLTHLVDYIWTKAAELNVDNRIVVTTTSDFSRTPRYNNNNGKDHWAVTSMLIQMRNASWTNRAVGASSGTHGAMKINPSTLQLDDNGITLEPRHVHDALRRLAGIANDPLANRFPLNAETVDLFNPNLSTGYILS